MSLPKTLRQIAGLTPPEKIDPKKTCLLLIDIQNDYFDPAALPIPEAGRVAQKAALLMDWADKTGVPVIHIQQVSPNPRAPIFANGSPGVEIHTGVKPRFGHRVIEKTLPSSFTGTSLDKVLKNQNTETLIICGMMTHMCVDSTARDAVHQGYKVIVAEDACATRELVSCRGQIISAESVHFASLAALADRFADVMNVASLCTLPIHPS